MATLTFYWSFFCFSGVLGAAAGGAIATIPGAGTVQYNTVNSL